MAGELEFSALHSDDRLLDALASRQHVSSDDPVAQLLAALAVEVDTAPVPLAEAWSAGLLARPVVAARVDTSAAASASAQLGSDLATAQVLAAAATAEAASISSASAQSGSDVLTREPGGAPPVALPSPAARRRPRMLLPRAAATAGVAAVVLGVGGVAAAVGGGGSPFDGIRRVVVSVTDQVAPPSREDKVARLLDQAGAALRKSDAVKAADLLTQVKAQLPGLGGAKATILQSQFTAMQEKLADLRHALTTPVADVPGVGVITNSVGNHPAGKTAGHPAAHPAKSTAPAGTGSTIAKPLGSSPADATESPADARADGITHNLPGPDIGNPADNLPGSQTLPAEGKIGEAETDVQDKAKTIPRPLPDNVDSPVGPVSPWRSPSSASIFDDPSVHQVVLEVAPTAGAATNGVTGGGNP